MSDLAAAMWAADDGTVFRVRGDTGDPFTITVVRRHGLLGFRPAGPGRPRRGAAIMSRDRLAEWAANLKAEGDQ